jgi:glycosyltransferase involved in cell wall biosynthesis
MENAPLVSVILPTYNRAEYLRRSIDSVLKQTFLNWELIIWDDGSTDETEELVRSYNTSKIKYFYDENHGAYYARNKAIAISCGEYLAFLDSDDEWIDQKLSAQIEVMIAQPTIDLIFANFLNVNLSSGQTSLAFERCLTAMKLLDVEKVGDDLFIVRGGILESLTVENFIATDTVLMKREVLEMIGPFCEGLKSSEDFELWWRAGLAGSTFAYIDKVYLTRYKYPGSLSSRSILTLENNIGMLDHCLAESLNKGRKDLIPYLNHLYRNAWQNLIPLYGGIHDLRQMMGAFFKSLKYGIRPGSFRLLLESLSNFKDNSREDGFVEK